MNKKPNISLMFCPECAEVSKYLVTVGPGDHSRQQCEGIRVIHALAVAAAENDNNSTYSKPLSLAYFSPSSADTTRFLSTCQAQCAACERQSVS